MTQASDLPDPRPSTIDVARRTLDLEAAGMAALRAALETGLGPALEAAVETIRAALRGNGRVIVTGVGKSGHVARKIAATLSSTGTPAYFMHAGEASHGDLGMIAPVDVVLALSWSGEAAELANIIAYTRRFRVALIALTAQADAALAGAADIALVLPAMPEACPNGLAPTTSTTMSMALGDALAVALLSLSNFSAHAFRDFHPGGKLGAQLRKAADLMHAGAAVPLVALDVPLSEAIVEMTSKGFGITGVVDGAGLLVGAVTDGDLRRAFQAGFVDRPVAEAMTRAPRSVPPDLLALEALAAINEAAITSLFVVEDGRPVGIIHIHDLLRAGVV
ncbi:KpsF/GutQ family sugar-phosphate isomerase [Aquabacter spiritensis]|uniref:Arabinose-5-phosphate isomerase n=1 Tax=Aquabacter spiritensis TaxID=933073 RepID=A0A4R3LX22_9HYPH|nr:KpsF/GutQ family sugar-phosphate isomerase [Aquabacter spiritensis]TCT04339.1 arabinose-5-phosphate isomerase [Aquabacter spiritensis]